MKLSTGQKIFLSLLSGVLLSLPWLGNSYGLLTLAGFAPLLILEDHYYNHETAPSRKLLGFAFLCFFTWNLLSTWWIANSTLLGVVVAILLNSFLFTIVFWLYHYSRKKIRVSAGRYLLVIYWVAFEYIYLNGELSWPWLSLGNGLASTVQFIQWYEYTGTLGGSIWILLVNLLLADITSNWIKNGNKNTNLKNVSLLLLLIIVPISISLIRYLTYKEFSNPTKIVIVQPNIDPFSDKFGSFTPDAQLNILLEEASKAIKQDADFFVGPETAILGYNEESKLHQKLSVFKIREFLKSYPGARFIIGAETAKEYLPDETLSTTARKMEHSPIWFDLYNSALCISASDPIQIYHKTKLVAGVEKVPFVKTLKFLERLSLKLGGTYGSLGSDNKDMVFKIPEENTVIAPVICYESVYGKLVAQSVQQGASLIFIITNDGWFGNSPGYRQHLNYARLRAIETRRSIARSANTGESAFIDQRGDIVQSLGWWQRGSIYGTLNLNTKQTLYVKWGDYLGRLAVYMMLIIAIYIIALRFKR